jgi:hypothetical protein
VTVTAEVPLLPSLVAVIVVFPAATPLTRPDASTVAIDGWPLLQITARPVSTLPLASRVVAVSCTLSETATLAELGVTVTEDTGTEPLCTVIVAEPLTPPLVAVIITVPAETPWTSPEDEAVATAELELAQVNVAFLLGLAVAVNRHGFGDVDRSAGRLHRDGAHPGRGLHLRLDAGGGGFRRAHRLAAPERNRGEGESFPASCHCSLR